MAIFPLTMYGIEQIIKHGKFKVYLFSLAAIMLSNYYMAYIVCIFSVIYFFAMYFSRYSLTDKLNITTYVDAGGNTIKAKKEKFNPIFTLRNSRFFNAGCRFAFASLSAAGIAAPRPGRG